jgi:protein gp37
MSNLSLQNTLNNIFDTVTETNVELPQKLKIIDINNNMEGGSKISKYNNYSDSATSSIFIGQSGGNLDSTTSSDFYGQQGGSKKTRNKSINSVTSSAFMGQLGGADDSATSSVFMSQSGGKSHKKNKEIDSTTSSAFMGQLGGANDSATSSIFMSQSGGKSHKKNKDIDSTTSSAFMGQIGGKLHRKNKMTETATSSAFVDQLGGTNDTASSTTSSVFMDQLGGTIDSATSSAFMGQIGGKLHRKNKVTDSATSSIFMGQLGGNNDSATSSAFIGQLGGANDSATSSIFMGQLGGATDSITSSAFIGQIGESVNSITSSAFIGQYGGGKKKQSGGNYEVNKLVSMLTSESNNAVSETTTETLEAQLREILNLNSKKTQVKQTAGSSNKTSVEDISSFFTNLKSQGVNVNIKLNDKTLSEFFNLAQNTTTEISEINVNNIIGGSKKLKKKIVENTIDGGANAGFQAFLDFKKFVANKLKISNGPSAAKIAGSINSEMKKKYEDLGAVEIAKKNTEYFEKNIDKIKSEFKELINKNPVK